MSAELYGLEEADERTQRRLAPEVGQRRIEGDEEAGVWVCQSTGWFLVSAGSIYLIRGNRIPCTWRFDGQRWERTKVQLETILPPKKKKSWWQWLLWGWVKNDDT